MDILNSSYISDSIERAAKQQPAAIACSKSLGALNHNGFDNDIACMTANVLKRFSDPTRSKWSENSSLPPNPAWQCIAAKTRSCRVQLAGTILIGNGRSGGLR